MHFYRYDFIKTNLLFGTEPVNNIYPTRVSHTGNIFRVLNMGVDGVYNYNHGTKTTSAEHGLLHVIPSQEVSSFCY